MALLLFSCLGAPPKTAGMAPLKIFVVVQPSRLHRRRAEACTTICMLNGTALGGMGNSRETSPRNGAGAGIPVGLHLPDRSRDIPLGTEAVPSPFEGGIA